MNYNSDKRVRRTEAASYLQERHGVPCAAKTLAKLACVGGGPVFQKYGRLPLYRLGDLDSWAESKLSRPVRCTSELSGA
jgi:hypothetical protein